MPMFKVRLVQTLSAYAEVEVEAEDEDSAVNKAYARADFGTPEEDNTEVTDVEEIK